MKTLQIMFDGGCKPDNGLYGRGQKYGSYMVTLDGASLCARHRAPLGHGTNNEAEFQTLEEALRETLDTLHVRRESSGEFSVRLLTDSMILKNRLLNNRIHMKPKYREASERMFDCAEACLKLLRQFRLFTVEWQPRERNVARFGH